jgi:hypothetical protein
MKYRNPKGARFGAKATGTRKLPSAKVALASAAPIPSVCVSEKLYEQHLRWTVA